MTFCTDEYNVGDLVCIKSYSESTEGWIQLDAEPGIVLEVIKIDDKFALYHKKFRCADLVVYWIEKQCIQTMPDFLMEKYSEWLGRIYEK